MLRRFRELRRNKLILVNFNRNKIEHSQIYALLQTVLCIARRNGRGGVGVEKVSAQWNLALPLSG